MSVSEQQDPAQRSGTPQRNQSVQKSAKQNKNFSAEVLSKKTHFSVEEVSYSFMEVSESKERMKLVKKHRACYLNIRKLIFQIQSLLLYFKCLTEKVKMERLRFRDVMHTTFDCTDDVMLDRIFRFFDVNNDGLVREEIRFSSHLSHLNSKRLAFNSIQVPFALLI